MKQRGLGKGLRALIAEADVPEEGTLNICDVAVEAIDPNPFQPRRSFSEEAITELKNSILQQGLLQPVVLRRAGDRYQIVLGERRWRAAKLAGLTAVPALVREVGSDEEMLELALLENLQREDLNPIEVATAIRQLQSRCGMTQEQVADKLGVSRAHVANTLRLLKLPPQIQAALSEGKISAGHARALLAVEDPARQKELFNKFLSSDNLTVRTAEALTRKPGKTPGESGDGKLDPRLKLEVARLEDRLQRKLGTRVKIKSRGRGGQLIIQYYTLDDLDRLMEILER